MVVRLGFSFIFLLLAAPFSFASIGDEAVTISSFDRVALSAKWTIPTTPVLAVALILQGSGNVALDGDVSSPLLGSGYRGGSTKLSDQIAAELARNGVASLRFSKRGVDDSAQLPNQTMPYLIQDAKAAAGVVKTRFPGTKFVLIGFSEGALVATAIASEALLQIDALFLFGLPTRSIDDLLAYQFLEWPVELIRSQLDQNHDGQIVTKALAQLGTDKLPLVGSGFAGDNWQSLDTNHDGVLSVATEVVPAYQKTYLAAMNLLQSPAFSGWYQSLRDMPRFAEVAKRITTPVFLYHAQDDAQVRWSWVATDQRYFGGKTNFRLFPKLGHCFSPMDGTIGQIKTTGAIDNSLFVTLNQDLTDFIGQK